MCVHSLLSSFIGFGLIPFVISHEFACTVFDVEIPPEDDDLIFWLSHARPTSLQPVMMCAKNVPSKPSVSSGLH